MIKRVEQGGADHLRIGGEVVELLAALARDRSTLLAISMCRRRFLSSAGNHAADSKSTQPSMPSSPILQAWARTVGPSPSICSLNRMPGRDLARIDASVALRT